MGILEELNVRGHAGRINEEIIYTVAAAYTYIEGMITRLLAPYGLTPAKFNILLVVRHLGKETGIPQNKISSLLLVTTSNITRMIDKLEEERYLARAKHPRDRRINLIRVTKRGSALLDEIWPRYEEQVAHLVSADIPLSRKRRLTQLIGDIFPSAKEA